MKSRAFRLGLAGIVSLSLGACSFDAFTYATARYGTTGGVQITLRCRDVYEVFDRADVFTMLVSTNALNEVLVACLEGGPPLAQRQREAAQYFLSERSNRPQCRIVGETEVTLAHREFSYSCTPLPTAAPARTRRG